jgi:glycine/D-amino acid oxidase-like deaminating enzyme
VVANLAAEGIDVAVLEARDVASGATGHMSGLIFTGLPTLYSQAIETYGRETARALWGLTVDNRRDLVSVADRLGVELKRTGSVVLATDEREAELLHDSAELMSADGFEPRFETTDPLDRGFTAALHYPDDAVVDTVALTKRLLETYSVPVHIGAEVFGVEQVGNDVLVMARGYSVKARTVVLAVNGYASLIDRYFADKVAPVRGHALVTQPVDENLCPLPGRAGPFAFRQTDDDRLFFTASSPQYEAAPAGPGDESTEIDLMRFIGRHFPEAVDRFARRESSVMGASSDGLPLIGALPHLPQVFFALGFAGYGLNLAFAAADLLTGLIVRGAEPEVLSARRLESEA